MKVQYGFAKLRRTLFIRNNEIFGDVGDTVMYCRQDEMTLCKVLTTKEYNGHYYHDQFQQEGFNYFLKVVKNIYFIAKESRKMDDFSFEKGIVYQFENNVIHAINSNINPWNNESDPKSLKIKIWATAIFFQRGLWINAGDFKIISEQEALACKKEYDKKMTCNRFDL